jgi:hypothetical protein
MDDHDLVLRRPWWLGDAHWTPHFFGTQAKEMADRPSLKPKPLQVVRRKEPVFTVSRRCCGILRTRTSASGQQFANWKDPPFLIGKSTIKGAIFNDQRVIGKSLNYKLLFGRKLTWWTTHWAWQICAGTVAWHAAKGAAAEGCDRKPGIH